MIWTDNARRPGAKYDGLAGFLGKPSPMITEPGERRVLGFTVMSPLAAGRSGELLLLSEPCFASEPEPWKLESELSADLKLTNGSAERMEVPQENQQRASSEAPRERLYSLRIQNTTSCNSGTYRCTLVAPEGQRNLSGTMILKVTGCSKGRKEETFKKYRAEVVLLLALVIFYVTLIIFTCKFARQQSIFPDFLKPAMEHAFLPVTSPNKHLEPVTLHKTELV
ncbi:CD83 antigen [Monodon monoceros]|uniref:CD83 antigen n=1 Tax=Monodon monoceros TaxID=40151 RepID=UPI0010F47483|nr:CD83 antigen [Monodon monoceros]